MLRASTALLLALAPLTLPTPAGAVPLADAVERIPLADESRTGYTRDSFRHWNTGLNPADGCNTRKEAILAKAVEAPQVADHCALTGGSWLGEYDNMVVTSAARLDVDHFVPLAEVFDSK
ncbi:hypothetical protein [Streptomyces omiyaensis]|uniref:HNH endonuclease n=1 Tax=Streptomyces omiyaensis TaxID=68247 RepID=A0ABW7C198_9ACTN|nr:hypothetical protein [Streptomyces omiyaensis]